MPPQQHISTVPVQRWGNGHGSGFILEPHGCCVCDPQPDSSPIGECPACHRLDYRKASA